MADVGASAEVRFLVDADATAIALGSGDVPVLGTPKVVALCEEAAVLAVAGELDSRSTSVGIHIALGGDYERRTIIAMSLRSTVWIAVAAVAYRFLRRTRRRAGL